MLSKKKRILLLVCLSFFANSFARLPYQNPALSPKARAQDLISRLTLDEKASLMFDQSPAIPRLGIKRFNWWSEALHGFTNNDSATVFPEPIGMAASFDDSLVVTTTARVLTDNYLKRFNEEKELFYYGIEYC